MFRLQAIFFVVGLNMINILGNSHSIQCEFNKLTIIIPKEESTIFPESDISQYNISWNDPTCGPSEKSNTTHLIMVADYSSCGTEAADNENEIIFKNTVHIAKPSTLSYSNPGLETVGTFATYKVICILPKITLNVTWAYAINVIGQESFQMVASESTSSGKFTVSINLYKSSEFNQKFMYPAVLDMIDRFNLEIELESAADLFIVPQSCYVTPGTDRTNLIRENIFTERCHNNHHHRFRLQPSAQNTKKFRFSLNAFRFKNSNGMVYIHCSTHICLKGSNDTKCEFGCRRKRRSEDPTFVDVLSKDYVIRTGLIIVTSSSINKEETKLANSSLDTHKNGTVSQQSTASHTKATNILIITASSFALFIFLGTVVFVCYRRSAKMKKRNAMVTIDDKGTK
ncbi:uromodulin-like [Clytia hemisphaerica]|uniref:uromodulin-like n=1 Tax=Clytia hemisphaerica TaxID=252671 RepID=UPI0034D423A6